MNRYLETFGYFVDDLLSSDDNLLKYELDILLMQYLFNSTNLDSFKVMSNQEDVIVAQSIQIMKFFYIKFWVPVFGSILSKFVFLIEGKPQKSEKIKKN